MAAQSLTSGTLRGDIILADGTPAGVAAITLEDDAGRGLRQLRSDARGQFSLPLLPPGRYSLLVEKTGFQPLRQRGVTVLPDLVTVLKVRISRRPPPITQVEEVAAADQRFTSGTPRIGEVSGRPGLDWFAPRNDVTTDGRNSAFGLSPRDMRWGFANSLNGLPQERSKLLVDGLPGSWIRHPALETEPGGAPVLPRFLFPHSQVVPHATDGEWPGGNGGTVGVVSLAPSIRFRFEPFAFWSGAIGTSGAQNPGDSSLTSVNVGATVSGSLVPDKAGFVVGFGYEELETPTARPWEVDTAVLGGTSAGLASTLEQVGRDSLGVGLASQVRPVVRSYRGGSGGFRVDWRLSSTMNLVSRGDFARFREWNPELGIDLSNGSNTRVDSRDFSGGSTLEYASGKAANELRIGLRKTRRDWRGSGLPATLFAAEGAGLGGLPALPGEFERTAIDISENFQYALGANGQHTVKVGGQYSNGPWTQRYLFGQDGSFIFGDVDGFANRRGAFSVAEVANDRVRFNLVEAALFGQIAWQLRPGLTALAGLRWDRQILGSRRTATIQFNPALFNLLGVRNNLVPNDNNNVAPRLGLTWEHGGKAPWSASLAASRHFGQMNPARFAEAVLHDGPVTVRRAVGALGSWSTLPDTTVTTELGPRLTLFSPSRDYRNPRTTKLDGEITRVFSGLGTLRVSAGYHHTDFLLRRTDLNLLAGPVGQTQEGRPVFGTLAQEGGVLAAVPGSNRRLGSFEMVSALASTGFQDHYQAGFTFSREAIQGLSLSGGYFWSRTRDNWLQSWTGDPADELSPFPTDPIGNEWAEGRSDYDVPHRATLVASWATGTRVPVTVGARYRFRSGLPFTPGFRPGVDANADGSGRNDPAFIDPGLPGMAALLAQNQCLKSQSGQFADRNSCREGGSHALDLSLTVGLPVRSLGGRLELLVDLFNLAATTTGVVDRAVLLVDPAGTLTTDALGNVTLPLLANPHFGKLLSRRTEPRMLRLGLRVAP